MQTDTLTLWMTGALDRVPSLDDILRRDPLFFERRLTIEELAALTGKTRAALAVDRSRGAGPRFIKHGRRVTYRVRDVLEFMRRNECGSTAEARTREQAQRLGNRRFAEGAAA